MSKELTPKEMAEHNGWGSPEHQAVVANLTEPVVTNMQSAPVKRRVNLHWEWLMFRAQTTKNIDRFWRWLAWKLPKQLVMWCCYHVAANATSGEWSNVNPSRLTFFEMMERWDSRPK